MANRKDLLERVRASARRANPERFREPEAQRERAREGLPKGRRGGGRTAIPLGVSLFEADLAALDDLVGALRRGGLTGASRSLVVREALLALRAEVGGLAPGELAAAFLARQARRQGGDNGS